MSRGRRAALLLGLALVLGAVAASDVASREATIRHRLGPLTAVLVTRRALSRGHRLTPADLSVRRVPARYRPVGVATRPAEVVGRRVGVALAAGAYLGPGELHVQTVSAGAPVRSGERVAEVIAAGSPSLIVAGSHVDVLVTRQGSAAGSGRTVLALENVDVLAAHPAQSSGGAQDDGPRVAAALRVTLRQAVYLAAAQSFASELRLLPRAVGDHDRSEQGLTITAGSL